MDAVLQMTSKLPQCDEWSPDKKWICTRSPAHERIHVATDMITRPIIVAKWDDAPPIAHQGRYPAKKTILENCAKCGARLDVSAGGMSCPVHGTNYH